MVGNPEGAGISSAVDGGADVDGGSLGISLGMLLDTSLGTSLGISLGGPLEASAVGDFVGVPTVMGASVGK